MNSDESVTLQGIEQRLRLKLDRLVQRLKSLYLLNGLARLACRLLAILLLLFLLDYFLDLPLPVRTILGLVGLAVLFFSLYRLILYPMRRKVSALDMALAVESRYPLLDGQLVSAVQLVSLADTELRNLSPRLIQASLEETHRTVVQRTFDDLFEKLSTRRAGILAIALLTVIVAYSAWQPVLAGVGLSRMFGAATAWPRKTTLLVYVEQEGAQFKLLGDADPHTEQRVVVAEGASLPLRIAVEGNDPGTVEVLQTPEERSRSGGRDTVISSAVRRGNGEYTARIRDIRTPLTLRTRGGDDDGRGREITVSLVPLATVCATEALFHYPEYLGMPDETRASAEIEAPVGTRVDLTLSLTHAVQRCVMRVATEEGETNTDLEAASDDLLTRTYTLVASSSGTYRVELWNEMGFRSLDIPVHPIICKRDEAPRVKLLHPRRKELSVVPGAMLSYLAVAEDDYGVSRMGIQYKMTGAAAEESFDFGDEQVGGDFGADRLVARYAIDTTARQFGVEGGRRLLTVRDSLLYSIFACDAQPDREKGSARTGTYLIDVVSPSEKIRLLTERQIRLRREVKSLLALQQERKGKVEALLGDAEAAEGDTTLGEQALLSLEMGQNQLTSRYRSSTRELAAIFEEYLFNRIDKSAGATAFLERVLQTRDDASLEQYFEPTLYRPLIEEFHSGAFGQMDIIARLLTLFDIALIISDDLSPRASGALAAAAVSTTQDGRLEKLREGLAVQEEILATLMRFLEKIAEWEDFQELLQMMHDLVEDQDRINTRTREWIRK